MTRGGAAVEMTERGLEMKKTGMTKTLTAIKHSHASKGGNSAMPYPDSNSVTCAPTRQQSPLPTVR